MNEIDCLYKFEDVDVCHEIIIQLYSFDYKIMRLIHNQISNNILILDDPILLIDIQYDI